MEHKYHQRRAGFFSLQWRLLITFTLVSAIIFVVGYHWLYEFNAQLIQDRLEESLLVTLRGAIQGIDGETFEALTQEAKLAGGKEPLVDLRYMQHRGWLWAVNQLNPQVMPYTFIKGNQEKEGWQTLQAENGKMALEMVAQNQPALILLDLMTPEVDGFQVIEELHKKDVIANIPVVVVTAKDLTDENHLRLNGIVETVILKGMYPHQVLLEQVGRLIRKFL